MIDMADFTKYLMNWPLKGRTFMGLCVVIGRSQISLDRRGCRGGGLSGIQSVVTLFHLWHGGNTFSM